MQPMMEKVLKLTLTYFKMNSFQASLDKYLTTPPEDNDGYIESLLEELTEEFWDKHENGFLESNIFYHWCDKLSEREDPCEVVGGQLKDLPNKRLTFEQAAKIIERAHSIFIDKG